MPFMNCLLIIFVNVDACSIFIFLCFLICSQDYESKRDYIIDLLVRVGLKIQFKPQGAFFLFAELPDDYPHSDVCTFYDLLVNSV